MPEKRWLPDPSEERWRHYVDLAVCPDGHMGWAINEPRLEREIRCRRCRNWTLASNYCGRCGVQLVETLR